MLLLDCVNEALQKVGDSRVRSVTANDTAIMAARTVKRSWESLCSESGLPWTKAIITLEGYQLGVAQLPGYVLEVERVYYDGKLLKYAERDSAMYSYNVQGIPRCYTFVGRSIALSPWINNDSRELVTLDVRTAHTIDDKQDSFDIPIPNANEYLLVLRTAISLCLDHLQDAQMAAQYTQEYTRLFSQQSHFVRTEHRSSSLL